MKNSRFILLVVLPVVLIAGATGFFSYDYFANTGMSTNPIADATTYRSGPFRVTVNINPAAPQVGNNKFTVKVTDEAGQPVTGATIKAFGEMAAMSTMSAMRAPADLNEVEPGLYAGPLRLEMRGEWPLSLYIEKDGIGETRLGFDMATGREGLSINSGGAAVGNAMAQTSGKGNGDSMAAESQHPQRNDLGFYIVGKYQLKVAVLGSGSMIESEPMQDAAMMSIKGASDEAMHDSKMKKNGRLSGMPSGEQMQDKVESMRAGTAMIVGQNMLEVTVLDLDDNPVKGANVRVAAQRDSATSSKNNTGMMHDADTSGGMSKSMVNGDSMVQSRRNPEVAQFASGGDGVYQGVVKLTSEGDYLLAVDVSTEAQGHGDLVLAFTTGEYGLRAATATPEGIAYYTCSMHSSVREAGPSQCPICSMDLTPVTNEQIQSGVITIDARRRQLIGVKTGNAVLRDLTKTIRAVGQVDYDERRISNVTLKFDAWIGDLTADYVGTQVERGQTLFTVYSPELLSAQQEYLESRARLASRGSNDSLVQAARRRLMLWDISAAQVRALERRGKPIEYLPISAPKSGTVVEKMIVEGSHMKTGDMLLRIADLSSVWIDAEVYEADLPLIEQGMNAVVTLPYLAQGRYEATVDYVYPYLDPKTRTARIRLVLDNPKGALKPDMYAEVLLQADLGRRLVVPEDAVLIAGESRVVFKDLGEGGKLKPVRVKTGQRVDGWVEITEGLSAGDAVVTSGNFLIAAEAKLKTGIDQW